MTKIPHGKKIVLTFKITWKRYSAFSSPRLAKTLASFFFLANYKHYYQLDESPLPHYGGWGAWSSLSISGNKEYFETLGDFRALNNVLLPLIYSVTLWQSLGSAWLVTDKTKLVPNNHPVLRWADKIRQDREKLKNKEQLLVTIRQTLGLAVKTTTTFPPPRHHHHWDPLVSFNLTVWCFSEIDSKGLIAWRIKTWSPYRAFWVTVHSISTWTAKSFRESLEIWQRTNYPVNAREK